MHPIKVGDMAPDFTLETDRDGPFSLSSHRGKPVVLFFYPQDDTEGCTNENIAFSQNMKAFQKLGTIVAGISPDSVADHARFRKKFGLKTILVADPDHIAINAFGVWGQKKTFGKEYLGLIRSTFLIAPDGALAHSWGVTRVKNHAETVLEAARALTA